MGVKTYQAYTIAEALWAAKRDLGSDAVILDTRTFRRGGMLGIGRRTIFELTATDGDRAEVGAPARAGTSHSAAAAARRAYARRSEPISARAAESNPDPVRTRRLAQALAEAHKRQLAAAPRPVEEAPPSPVAEVAEAPARARCAVRLTGPHGGSGADQLLLQPARVARRFILTPAGAGATHDAAGAAGALPSVEARSFAVDVMHEELSAIKAMVGQVLQRNVASPGAEPPRMPPNLFAMYLEMLGQDLSRELAERIVGAVREELGGDAPNGADAREAVLRHLARLVPAADPPLGDRSPDDRPLTIALIGPTGVGKTTTLAKLAATLKLREQRRVGLVTCDTYRIAAVDQLRTYASIIGLRLEVAITPAQVKQAVEGLSDCDVVLIDTAGRGPNDRGRLDELTGCLAAARPHEVHLVLSSTSSERVLLREAEAFAGAGADRIVLTKLDEAVSFGVLINVMQAVGKRLSFITTGQEVPDQIEPGRPHRLAELVLGGALVQ